MALAKKGGYGRGCWQTPARKSAAGKFSYVFLFLCLLILCFVIEDFGALIILNHIQNLSRGSLLTFTKQASQPNGPQDSNPEPYKEYPITCSPKNQTQTCPNDYPTKHKSKFNPHDPPSTCPSYFSWIHEDIRPWKQTGITKDMVERANRTANFRLAIIDDKVYVKYFFRSYQTRDIFTIWGIVQLVRKYPGKLPDLELMFDCEDTPAIKFGEDKLAVLFGYCNDEDHVDLILPDWAFWGWSEINVRQWEGLSKEIKKGREKTSWEDRVPYAYWKGNPYVGKYCKPRRELLKCNRTDQADWNAPIYV